MYSVETKEVRLSPKTDDHDLATKIKATQKFLDKVCRVAVAVGCRLVAGAPEQGHTLQADSSCTVAGMLADG